MGPVITAAHRDRVLSLVASGEQEGAKIICDGRGVKVPDAPNGFYVGATIVDQVAHEMTIAREEVFGPVAAVMKFETIDEAVALANDSVYGLAAGVWTRDLNNAHRLARRLESGMVWVNCWDHGDMTQPWGGYKQTGQGRDKCFESLLAHTQTKSVWINLG
jgi:gamma-glutamyl-gamma-aminobutyraldehyde dehydrogenase